MSKQLKMFLKCVILIVSLLLVLVGQKYVGYGGLTAMLAGLCGLLFLLWSYNKTFR